MYVSGIVQYSSTTTSAGTNVRFRWEYRPGSELFVVYTDDYNTETPQGARGAAQPRAGGEGEPAVPSLSASRHRANAARSPGGLR